MIYYILLIDKDRSVPESGYLERTLSMALSAIEITEDDCKCTDGLHTSIINKDHLKMLIGKYYKLNESDEWQLFTGDEKNLIEHEIILRSPMTCVTKNYKICKKCFGEKKIRTKYVGITSAQVITERLTQLLLRTSERG